MLQPFGTRSCAAQVAHDATRVSHLSEGQYRRLLLAIRLLALPSVLALDELTSGQDSATALHLMRGAAKLARRGLTVLVVIHQPSCEIFSLFKSVVALRPDGDGCDVFNSPASLQGTSLGHVRAPGLRASPGSTRGPLRWDPTRV